MGKHYGVKSSEYLKEIAKYHVEWVKTVKSLGGGEYSEDIVQEMYLKIFKYVDANKIIINNKLQKGYIFFTLKSILYEYAGKKKMFPKEDISNVEIVNDSELESKLAFEKFCVKIDNYLKSLETKARTENNENYWYDAKMFQTYKDEELSMRKLAKLSGISWVSVFHTLKNVKIDLKNRFQEDWDDLMNEDYERI
jgi:hypothetical protein